MGQSCCHNWINPDVFLLKRIHVFFAALGHRCGGNRELKIRIWPSHRPAIATIGVRKALACTHACPGEGWFALLRKTLSRAWLVAMAALSLGSTDDALGLRDPTPSRMVNISPEPIAPPAAIMPAPCVIMRAAITSQATASSTQPTRPLSSRHPKRARFCPAALQSAPQPRTPQPR
jgi:hypothetical protein